MVALGASSVAQDWEEQHPIPDFAPLRGEVPFQSYQWRARLTRYKDGGFEVMLRLYDRQRLKDTFEKFGGCGAPRRFRSPGEEPDPENIKRARYRRRTAVRQLAREKQVTHLLTLSTRQQENTRAEMMVALARFIRLYAKATGRRLDYIEVPERHPTNPGHIHMHLAVTSFLPVRLLRRLWYIALGGKGGERGAETPGGVHMRPILAKTKARRSARIARYISDYMTKDTVEEFNKKAYTSSRGSVPESEGWWLTASGDAVDSLSAAVTELMRVLGLSFSREDSFVFPSGRGAFFQHVPGDAAGMVKGFPDHPPF